MTVKKGYGMSPTPLSLLNRIKNRVTSSEKHVPEYLVFNKHILSGYRVNFTVKDSLISLFTLHNETLNIWTHVAGFVLFMCLLIALCYAPPVTDNVGAQVTFTTSQAERDPTEPLKLLQKAQDLFRKKNFHLEEVKDHLRKLVETLTDIEHNVFREKTFHPGDTVKQTLKQSLKFLNKELKRRNFGKALHIEEVKGVLVKLETQLVKVISNNFKVEYWPMYLYLVGAMCCMFCSSMAHTFSICSPKANKWWWRIDYVGIAIMITSSFCPVIYYTFLNHVLWRNFYLVCIFVLGTIVAGISLLEVFQRDSYRYLRTGLFVGLAFFAVFPLIHALSLVNWKSGDVSRVVAYEILMGVLYLGGAFVYAIQFPECKFPGKFDLFFNSHQVFHVCIVCAAYAHYMAVIHAIDWRYGNLSVTQ